MTFRVKDANKSSLKTKAKIKDAFFKLLNERSSASKITVKELCQEAGIQRSTFYIHYKDIYDIEDSIIDNFYDKIGSFVPKTVNGPEEVKLFFNQLFDFIEEQGRDIEIIFRDREAPEIIEKAKTKIIQTFAISLNDSKRKVYRVRSYVFLNGVFAALYSILNGASNLTIHQLKEETLIAADHLFIEE